MQYWPSKSHILEVLGQNLNLTLLNLKNAKFTIIEHIQAPIPKNLGIRIYTRVLTLESTQQTLQNEWSQCYVSTKIQKSIMRQNRSKSAKKYRTSDPMYGGLHYSERPGTLIFLKTKGSHIFLGGET